VPETPDPAAAPDGTIIGSHAYLEGLLAAADHTFLRASGVDDPEPRTDTIARLTGGPVRAYADWARDHVADFRPLRDPS
jgi:hypothetical protein